jgi:hypothetical protein
MTSSSSPSNLTVIRARVHNVRAQGAKMAFLTLRQQTATLQGVLVVGGKEGDDGPIVSKQMLKFVNGIPVSAHKDPGSFGALFERVLSNFFSPITSSARVHCRRGGCHQTSRREGMHYQGLRDANLQGERALRM